MLRTLVTLVGFSLTFSTLGTSASIQDPAEGLTVISAAGRQLLPTMATRGHDMVALDEIARLFQLDLREDSKASTLTVTYRNQTIILTPNQDLVSVSGRLVSLGSAPRRTDNRWLVPLDFLSRALGPLTDEGLEFRPLSRLLLVGDVHVPRITVNYRARRNGGSISLKITPDTPHTVTQEAGRLIVQFEADAIDVAPLPLPRGSFVTRFESVAEVPGIAIDLGLDFGSFVVSSMPAPDEAVELMIDLRAAGAETTNDTSTIPETPLGALPLLTPADPLPDFAPRPTVQAIVIDAGHGGDEDGARGPKGALEKHFTLSVALRLRDAIESQLGMRVILTRNRDETVDLDERAEIANNNKADLFISLHANASIRPSASGAKVFYLSIDEYGEEARELAEREGQAIPVIGGGTREIDLILWEMAQVRYLERSARFAELVEQELRRRVPMSSRAIQQAPLRVLVGANMPAVLLEMGFISNPFQEQQFGSASFQNALVDSLISSIVRYRDYLQQSVQVLAGTSEPDLAAGAQSLQGRNE